MDIPAPDEVDIWVVPLPGGDPAAERELLAVLPGPERRRAHGIRASGARTRFVLARAALRRILGAYLGVAPATVEIVLDENGKPHLAGAPAPLAFSLSHTRGLAAIAVTTRAAVGIDVEALDRRVDLATMRRALGDEELEPVLAEPPERRTAAFLRRWTMKEAHAKAVGTGIWTGSPGPPGAWAAQPFDPADGFVGAVVAADGPWVTRRREWPGIIAAPRRPERSAGYEQGANA